MNLRHAMRPRSNRCSILSSSDSGILDNALELVALGGRELPHAVMMLMPEAWENVRDLDPQIKAFYRYHATLMEPWDGPAAICFSDGRVAGMTLDRNGLRPATWLVTHDGFVVAASEAGALEIEPERIKQKGRLGPGQMVVADLQYNKLWKNDEIKAHYASRRPYAHWVSEYIRPLKAHDAPIAQFTSHRDITLQSPVSAAPIPLWLHRRRTGRAAETDGGEQSRKPSARWAMIRRTRSSRSLTARSITFSASVLPK